MAVNYECLLRSKTDDFYIFFQLPFFPKCNL
uniref:Uncharacterized protein n=1 Tax=Anguilla anguilla TaxID=7936 RepID=A0A0E9U1P0_ANGAN